MVNRQRMKRQWMDFNTGSTPLNVGPVSTIRVLLRSVIEPDLDRKLTNFTVVRSVFRVSLRTTSGSAMCAAGLISLNANMSLTVMGPISDPHADWFWKEHFAVDTIRQTHQVDVAGKRRETGLEREVYLYLLNRSTSSTVEFFAGGRLLVLQH